MHRKFISLLLSLALVAGLAIPAFAAESNVVKTVPTLSQEKKEELTKWVSYDDEDTRFVIKEGAKQVLTPSDYSLLNYYINTTNTNISRADFSTGEVFVVSPENETVHNATRGYNEGVTKIEFHWWGATIYLSRTTVIAIGAGVTIGGIWVPEAVVSKILATVGAVVALCPGGIAFDYNYIAAGISNLVPGMSIIFPAVSNFRWQ